MATSVTREEWEQDQGLVPAKDALYLPNCRALLALHTSVPGQALRCPDVWVVLVECIGILLDMPVQQHPQWEQLGPIKSASRFYPTMQLLTTHHDTALRRLQQVTSLRDDQLSETAALFATPIQVGGVAELMTPDVVAVGCGPEAMVLCRQVEGVLLRHASAKNVILTARFNFAQENEAVYLGALRRRMQEVQDAQEAVGRSDMHMVPLVAEQEAARHSLADINVAAFASLIPEEFDLRTMLARDMTDDAGDIRSAGLAPQQFVAVAVLQVVAALALRMETHKGEDEATPMVSTRDAAAAGSGAPTDLDLQYWEALQGRHGEELLFSLPPFHRDDAPTWGALVRCISNGGKVSAHVLDYVPSHSDLQLKQGVLQRAIEAWEGAAQRLLHPWEKRNWAGLRTVHAYGHSHVHLIRPLLWAEACLSLAEPLARHHAVAQQLSEAEARVCHLRSSLERGKTLRLPPCHDVVVEKSDVEMQVSGRGPASFTVSLTRGGSITTVSVPPRASQLTPTESLPHYGQLAFATDESGVALTNEQILWVFRSLDVNGNGWLEREEVEQFYRKYHVVQSAEWDEKALSQELTRILGPSKQIGLYEFKTLMLHVAKQ